jgi:hypothetical protein
VFALVAQLAAGLDDERNGVIEAIPVLRRDAEMLEAAMVTTRASSSSDLAR